MDVVGPARGIGRVDGDAAHRLRFGVRAGIRIPIVVGVRLVQTRLFPRSQDAVVSTAVHDKGADHNAHDNLRAASAMINMGHSQSKDRRGKADSQSARAMSATRTGVYPGQAVGTATRRSPLSGPEGRESVKLQFEGWRGNGRAVQVLLLPSIFLPPDHERKLGWLALEA